MNVICVPICTQVVYYATNSSALKHVLHAFDNVHAFHMQLARIIEQDRPKAKAVVQLLSSKEVLSVHFDNICEYVGDVEDMDM